MHEEAPPPIVRTRYVFDLSFTFYTKTKNFFLLELLKLIDPFGVVIVNRAHHMEIHVMDYHPFLMVLLVPVMVIVLNQLLVPSGDHLYIIMHLIIIQVFHQHQVLNIFHRDLWDKVYNQI
jgi:hypothetical protein